MTDYLVLAGVLVVVLGFALRMNPLLVVTLAALATGLLGGLGLIEVISAFGEAFNTNRYISVVWIVLPVIGLLERYGLQQRARALIEKMRGATTGRLLLVYLGFRQVTAALGLTSVAGHPQTVRPLVAPMAEAAAEKQHGALAENDREKVLGMSAATDNVGLFFGEDIFVAIASILLIQGVFQTYGYELTPLQLSVWAIPTAICAFIIHGGRLLMFDRWLGKQRRRREAKLEMPPIHRALRGAAEKVAPETKPSPQRGEGWMGGLDTDDGRSAVPRSPSPRPSPRRGEGE